MFMHVGKISGTPSSNFSHLYKYFIDTGYLIYITDFNNMLVPYPFWRTQLEMFHFPSTRCGSTKGNYLYFFNFSWPTKRLPPSPLLRASIWKPLKQHNICILARVFAWHKSWRKDRPEWKIRFLEQYYKRKQSDSSRDY